MLMDPSQEDTWSTPPPLLPSVAATLPNAPKKKRPAATTPDLPKKKRIVSFETGMFSHYLEEAYRSFLEESRMAQNAPAAVAAKRERQMRVLMSLR